MPRTQAAVISVTSSPATRVATVGATVAEAATEATPAGTGGAVSVGAGCAVAPGPATPGATHLQATCPVQVQLPLQQWHLMVCQAQRSQWRRRLAGTAVS
mmetsp:Transcript_63609/g.148339  ORF Transcript_63609/g.148339 Transcript_63609/m.148339 type:complete len:100 (+) Transcript_63609:693-992(+)